MYKKTLGSRIEEDSDNFVASATALATRNNNRYNSFEKESIILLLSGWHSFFKIIYFYL